MYYEYKNYQIITRDENIVDRWRKRLSNFLNVEDFKFTVED